MIFSFSRITVIALLIWICSLFYISFLLVNIHGGGSAADHGGDDDDDDRRNIPPEMSTLMGRIDQANYEIAAIRARNAELQAAVKSQNANFRNSRKPSEDNRAPLAHLSPNHESLRRTIESNAMELWYHVMADFKHIEENLRATNEDSLKKMESSIDEEWRNLYLNVRKLGDVDGAKDWRQNELEQLSTTMQHRLDALQNPKDCQSAKKLLCNLNKGCGFGCQIHHVVYCFITAYATQRTMILETDGWRYSKKGWTSVFQPTSRTCEDVDIGETVQWKGPKANEKDETVKLPIVDSVRPRPEQLPLAFPQEFARKLIKLHGNPPVWWIAQFLAYLMRYSDSMARELKSVEEDSRFQHPIIGLHVRRTDKIGSEAAFHPLQEYMDWAEHYHGLLRSEFGGDKRIPKRIFLATDDTKLLDDAKNQYEDWEFIGSADVANTAQVGNRYSDSGLHGLLRDIHLLSLSDYIVCTFSSQICRVAYELQQFNRGDWTGRLHSLDDLFYFGGQSGHQMSAILPHKAAKPHPVGMTDRLKPSKGKDDEIDLKPGDTILIAGNHWDGWSKGRNLRTGQNGIFPSYKVKEKWRIAGFPQYPTLK